jgi:excisionase family DNA binding protein
MARTIAGALDVRRLAYSLQEAAAALSVGVTKLQRAISHDLLRSTKIGASIRIPADEVERIARDGLPDIPAGYKRKTNGNTRQGKGKRRRG